MTFTPRDVKDVSALVAKKLEFYMNQERREDRFDTQGRYRTHPKMRTLDLMYQMLDATEISKKSHRKKHRSSSSKRRDSKKTEEEEGEAYEESEHDDRRKKGNKERSKEKKKKKIAPVVINNTLRVVPQHEAERLTDMANKVFEEQDLDKLHVIHRYRPNSRDIAPLTENGKVANYTLHVGSALNSTNYVNYYVKEGLHSSKKECAKRLQRLKTKDKEDGVKPKHENDSSPDGRTGQSPTNDDTELPIFNPLIDQSTESLLSTSLMSGNLTPISKDKPAYTTVFTSTRPSSRGSSDKQSKASSQLNKARMFANGYGYRIVADKHNGFTVSDSPNRNESRADIASSEEYCKFNAKNNSIDSGRTGDGLDAVVMSNMPPLSEADLDYNKFQSAQSSVLLSGLEDDSRARSYYKSSRLSSQRSVGSQRSYRSGNSSPIYMEGSMSACTEESDIYDTEAGPDTARSTSYPISTPRRSKKVYRPIETLITNKDVPRLGLTSDINDSNCSWNSWTAEEYVTAEEKAKMNTDARAIEDKKNVSQERAGDGVTGNSNDARADRSLQKVWSDRNEHQINNAQCIQTDGTEKCDQVANKDSNGEKEMALLEANNEMVASCPPLSTIADKGDELIETVPQNTNECQSEADRNDADNEKEGNSKSEVLLSSRTNKTSIDFNTGASRPSSRSTSSTCKKVKGKEKSDAQRGEDKVESMELHRGQVPDVEKNKLLKIKIERGEDTPRTMAAKGRLTKSAKGRGMSNYYTMGDEERGLEKEYFQSMEKDVQETYVKARISDDEEDLETPASSRPTSASSIVSSSSKDSVAGGKKKSNGDALDHGKINGSRPLSQIEKSVDGRGDDSVSIKSGSVVSAGSREGKTKENRNDGSYKGQERSSEQNSPIEATSADMSGGSRGSRSVHMKFGVGEGYCVDGEVLNRGYDEGIHRQPEKMSDTKHEDSFKVVASKDDDNRPSSRASQVSLKNKDSSRTSQTSVKSESKKKDTLQGELDQPVEMKAEGIVSNNSKLEESAKKEISEPEIEKHDIVEEIDKTKSQTVSVTDMHGENKQEHHSSPQNICEDNVKDTNQIEKTSEKDKDNTENKENSHKDSLTKGFNQISNHSMDDDNKAILPEEATHNKHVNSGQTSFEKTEKEGADHEMVQNVPEISKEKVAMAPSEEGTPGQEIPVEEKAFVECDLSDHDVVKEAVSGSASMFNEDSDTVIDFRPSSASTAISVGIEQSAENRRRSVRKPAKIVEVTETESNFGSARESYRSSKVAESDVVHPATIKRRESKDHGVILNIADVKLDQVAENGEITHPAVKRRSVNGDVNKTSRSSSLPGAKSNALDGAELYDADKKCHSTDRIPYTNDIDEVKSEDHVDKIEDNKDKDEEVKKRSIDKEHVDEEKVEQIGATQVTVTDKEPKEETTTGKEESADLIKEVGNELNDRKELPKVDNEKREYLEEINTEKHKEVGRKEVMVETGSDREIIAKLPENLNQDNKLEENKEKQIPSIVGQSKHETGSNNNTNVQKDEENFNKNIIEIKTECASDASIDLKINVDTEKYPIHGNIVADIISNNLIQNNETPRTPRSTEILICEQQKKEIDNLKDDEKESDLKIFEDIKTASEKEKSSDPSPVESRDQLDKKGGAVESQLKNVAPESQNKAPDNTDKPCGNVTDGGSGSKQEILPDIQNHPSEVNEKLSRVHTVVTDQNAPNDDEVKKDDNIQDEKHNLITDLNLESKDEVPALKESEAVKEPRETADQITIEGAKIEKNQTDLEPTAQVQNSYGISEKTKTERTLIEKEELPSQIKTTESKANDANSPIEESPKLSEEKDKESETKHPSSCIKESTDHHVGIIGSEKEKGSHSETKDLMSKREIPHETDKAHAQKAIAETVSENGNETIPKAHNVVVGDGCAETPQKTSESVSRAEIEITQKSNDCETERSKQESMQMNGEKENTQVKASEIHIEKEPAVEISEVENNIKETPTTVPEVESKTEEVVVNAPKLERNEEETAEKAPVVETKAEEPTENAHEVELKTEEVILKSSVVESKPEEALINAPGVNSKSEEVVGKALEAETSREVVVNPLAVETKTEESPVNAHEAEINAEEVLVKAPVVEIKSEETLVNANVVDTKSEEELTKDPVVETKTEEVAVSAPKVETNVEEALVKAVAIESKLEETVETKEGEIMGNAPEVELKLEARVVNDPGVEIKTEDTEVTASRVETNVKEEVVNIPVIETKTEDTEQKTIE